MRLRWRLILPIVGVVVFSGLSLHSYRLVREGNASPGRYFLWSTIRLDSDPLNKRSQSSCINSQHECVDWNIADADLWVHPGLLERALGVSALPAFVVVLLIVAALSKVGISQVLSFMIFMPLLISAWFFCVGWLVDRWTLKRAERGVAQVTDKSS